MLVLVNSAGVGRTGVFIALDIALERVEVEEAVDINGTITRMRQQRMKLVQTVVSNKYHSIGSIQS